MKSGKEECEVEDFSSEMKEGCWKVGTPRGGLSTQAWSDMGE